MEPTWVRAAYLHVMSLIGVMVILFGALSFALGVVHTVAPTLKAQDPISRLAVGVSNIAESVLAAQQRSSSDGGISLGSDSSNRQVRDALKKVKTEVDRQSRTGAINDLIKGIVLAGLGGAIYAFHMARTDDGRRRKAAKRTGSTAATASAPNPPAVPVT